MIIDRVICTQFTWVTNSKASSIYVSLRIEFVSDTPMSPQYSLTIRYLSMLQETLVLADSNANGPGELSVHRGQQVEVVGLPPSPLPGAVSATIGNSGCSAALAADTGRNNMVIVRLSEGKGGSARVSEGLVPLTCLKQPTGGFKFKNGLASVTNEGK